MAETQNAKATMNASATGNANATGNASATGNEISITLPRSVARILRTLEKAGFEAYAVGGCVRDTLLGRQPGDWDITTSARPQEVKALFRRTIDTGIQHGTVTVLMREEEQLTGYEVTTYRIDGEYLDGRHPKEVIFTPSLHEDLARRDFTINAMACNERDGIVDDFGGMDDLEKRQIRAVGNPLHRFQEDALRMLRAIRFSAQLDFAIEAETLAAVSALAPNLEKVSKERIAAELTKLLLSKHPERLQLVFDTGLAPYVTADFPKLADFPRLSGEIPAKKGLRWGMLLRELPADTKRILRELKLDNDTLHYALSFGQLFRDALPENETEIRQQMADYGTELWFDALSLRQALLSSSDNVFGEEKNTEPGVSNAPAAAEQTAARESLAALEKKGRAILRRGDCIGTGMLAVNGKDLMAAGVPKGPEIGRVLQALLQEVLADPARNERSYLLGRLDALL